MSGGKGQSNSLFITNS